MPSTNATPDDLLFIGTHGHVNAVYKKDGTMAWSTSLPKTGYSIASILPEDGVLLCGSGGYVFALDPRNGEILWTNGLKGLGNGMIYLATMKNGRTEGMISLAGQAAANAAAASAAT